jgi:peptidyl-prolyl cis-trans isomerase SurA
MKKVLSMLKKNQTSKVIKEKFNSKDNVSVMFFEGIYEEGAEALPKGTKMEKGVSEITNKGEYYYVTNVKEVLPSGSKTLDECRGKLVNEYQQYLEQNWVNELKKEFNVKVENPVFEKVKNQIKK